MKPLIHALAPAALAILVGACATADRFRSYESSGSKGTTWVEVQNNNWADVRVFLVRYGEGDRLGMVTSMTTERFRVPRAWVNQAERIAIRVEPIGGGGFFASQDVPLVPGAVLELTVQNHLALSSMIIR